MKRIFILILFNTFIFNLTYSQSITTICGNGSVTYSGDNGSALLAGINLPASGNFDLKGNYYFVGGLSSNRIRMVNTSGIIQTVAGISTAGYSGDGGPATAAQLKQPYGVALDNMGNLYIADYGNYRIRKINFSTQIIETIAGNGIAATTGDGAAAISASVVPYGICVDKIGNIFFIDGYGTKVRKIDLSGVISTIGGTGIGGFSGDGGPATNAMLSINYGICVDTSNNIYISNDTRIRKINMTTGIISTIAGTGVSAYDTENIPATSASFNAITINIDNKNNIIYIADIVNDRVYSINSSDTFNLIAGTGFGGYNGDGIPATASQLFNPQGVSIDDCGNIYIADSDNRRIRKVTLNPPTTPTITLSGITTATVGATVTVNATVSGAGSSYAIRWYRNSALFSTTTTPTTTFVKGIGIDTITARIVPTIVYCYDSTTAEPHVVMEAPVGVGYVPERQQYTVYPNPAQQQLTISSPAPIHTITISSPVGQQWLAYTGNGSKEVQLSVAHLPPGLYIVRVNNGYSTKMIKE